MSKPTDGEMLQIIANYCKNSIEGYDSKVVITYDDLKAELSYIEKLARTKEA